MSNRLLSMILTGIIAASPFLAGCEVLTYRMPDFPNAETGEDGQIYVLDDLRDIANDPDLTLEEKQEAFRELGIEDQDMINALLTLPAAS